MTGKFVYSHEGEGDMKDEERARSMADEGGASGAHMDADEQLETAPRRLRRKRRIPWMWGAAAASAALGGAALARTIGNRRAAGGTEMDVEIEAEPRRGSARPRRGAKTQRTGGKRTGTTPASSKTKGAKGSRRSDVTLASAERGRGSPKRRRGGNNANVRKGANTARTRQSATR